LKSNIFIWIADIITRNNYNYYKKNTWFLVNIIIEYCLQLGYNRIKKRYNFGEPPPLRSEER